MNAPLSGGASCSNPDSRPFMGQVRSSTLSKLLLVGSGRFRNRPDGARKASLESAVTVTPSSVMTVVFRSSWFSGFGSSVTRFLRVVFKKHRRFGREAHGGSDEQLLGSFADGFLMGVFGV